MDVELKPRHRTIDTNGLRLHAVEAGPESGPLLLLLHGFPEFWYGWRHQIESLAAAGYRVLAPDQRGYNLSDKPRGVSSYSLDLLARDIVGLIDDAGYEKAYVAGHDWGGAVGWWLGVHHPERIEKLALLNIPHPYVMLRTVKKNPVQRKKSSYIAFFQLPWLPERVLRARNWAATVKTLRKTSRPGTFPDADLVLYREAWSQPGAITAMLNWYRAALRKGVPRLTRSSRVTVPTLLLWGAQDSALLRDMAQPSIDLCDDGRLVFLEEATHWVQHEEPDAVNAILADFFS
ncbi:MAG TPA: alpha/beta hydrolase [Thermoanaerobaculia bacterium]|nr:alpha/beta hydrolase [Thermoanaerobaculia bacterium]